MSIDFDQAAELYLGSTRRHALKEGGRRFTSAAKAIRFALEEAAPVSLRGASLRIGAREFSAPQFRALYDHRRFPLTRKAA